MRRYDSQHPETDDHGSDDVLGRVYEYFLGQFAGKETGKDAGVSSVVDVGFLCAWERAEGANPGSLPPGSAFCPGRLRSRPRLMTDGTICT